MRRWTGGWQDTQNLLRRSAIGITADRLFDRCQRVIGDLVRQADALRIEACKRWLCRRLALIGRI